MLHQAASCKLHSTVSHRIISESGGTFLSTGVRNHRCLCASFDLMSCRVSKSLTFGFKLITSLQNNSIQQ